jgi:hypothetical protein
MVVMKCRNPALNNVDCWVADAFGITNPDCDFCKLKDQKAAGDKKETGETIKKHAETCRLCGKLLLWSPDCGYKIKDLVPGGHDSRLCRDCEKQVVSNYLIGKGVIDDPATLS